MTKMSDSEFEQLLRSINQQPISTDKSRMDATKQALRRRMARLFEKRAEPAAIDVRATISEYLYRPDAGSDSAAFP
jgi:hypothetical protein